MRLLISECILSRTRYRGLFVTFSLSTAGAPPFNAVARGELLNQDCEIWNKETIQRQYLWCGTKHILSRLSVNHESYRKINWKTFS